MLYDQNTPGQWIVDLLFRKVGEMVTCAYGISEIRQRLSHCLAHVQRVKQSDLIFSVRYHVLQQNI